MKRHAPVRPYVSLLVYHTFVPAVFSFGAPRRTFGSKFILRA